jgi:hypothetical protein
MLTIVSVSYNSKALLDMNYKLVKALNPNVSFHWIVVQNTPESDLKGDLAMDDPRFEMIRGPVLTELEKQSISYGSFQHAKALNIALAYTDSNLILILDPDCFIYRPNWIQDIICHIEKEQLAFFGTPYHPRCFHTYRYFPNAFCMFINRKLLQEKSFFYLDFTPKVDHRQYNKSIYSAVDYHSSNFKYFANFFLKTKRRSALKTTDIFLVLQRCVKKKIPQLMINSYYDTGYRIYKRYQSVLKHEELEVFAHDERSFITKIIEFILPDNYRTFPRNKRQIRKTPDTSFEGFGTHCDQYYWKDQPFAFHVNGSFYYEEIKNQAISQLLSKTEEFIKNLQ